MENLPERLGASGAPEIRKKLQGVSGGKILDVATGDGDFINTPMRMLKNYDYFVGIEISKKVLARVSARIDRQRN